MRPLPRKATYSTIHDKQTTSLCSGAITVPSRCHGHAGPVHVLAEHTCARLSDVGKQTVHRVARHDNVHPAANVLVSWKRDNSCAHVTQARDQTLGKVTCIRVRVHAPNPECCACTQS